MTHFALKKLVRTLFPEEDINSDSFKATSIVIFVSLKKNINPIHAALHCNCSYTFAESCINNLLDNKLTCLSWLNEEDPIFSIVELSLRSLAARGIVKRELQ